jgi:glycosyltransferase involved in cell wall biosynthesis
MSALPQSHNREPLEELPLVTIGIPLYNEEKFISQSLHSIFSQDYPNIEIIISDNASTDDTLKICNELSKEHPDVKINSFRENLGATENFAYVLREATGKYFMWASGHDLWDKNLISTCVHLLEKSDSFVIAFGSSEWIDEHGDRMERSSGWTDTRGMGDVARFFSIFWGNMHPVLGLMRSSTLKEVMPIGSFVGSDLALLGALALKGHFVHATSTNWKRREFRHEQTHSQKVTRYKSREYGLTKGLISNTFPMLILPTFMIALLARSNMSFLEKSMAIIALIFSLPARYIAGK